MSLSSIALVDDSSATTTFTQIGQTNNGAEYRDVTRSLSEPRSLMITYKVSPAGSKANDHLVISIRDVGINADTGESFTSSARVDISVSRDADTPALEAQDLMSFLGDFFTQAAWRDEVASAQLPTTAKA